MPSTARTPTQEHDMAAKAKLVPAILVRRHIDALRATGMSVRKIAHVSGVPLPTVAGIAKGVGASTLEHNAAAILAITTPIITRAGFTEATKPRRQCQALIRIGYDQLDIRRRTGVSHAGMVRLLNGCSAFIADNHAVSIDRVYRDRWYIPGPSKRARTIAASKHWASPLAWEPNTIADPAALPDTGPIIRGPITVDSEFVELALGGDREVAVMLRRADLTHAFKLAAERGIPHDVAARRLAPSERSLQRHKAADRELAAA